MKHNIKSTTCRICGNDTHQLVLDNISTPLEETYSLVQCESCSFISTLPMPSAEMLSKYYHENYWQTATHNSTKTLEDHFFRFRMQQNLRILKKIVPSGGQVLDIGAGDGKWVQIIREAGFDGIGIDKYSTQPQDKFIINGEFETTDFEDNSFDGITCLHVLEHVPDPVKTLNIALSILKQGGVMLLEVPHIDSLEFKFFRKRWFALDVPAHLNHFNLSVLKNMIEKNKDVQIKKVSYFSLRSSAAVTINSLFPRLDPSLMRANHGGRYPLGFKLLYLTLQTIVLPFSWLVGKFKRGSLLRIVLTKNKSVE